MSLAKAIDSEEYAEKVKTLFEKFFQSEESGVISLQLKNLCVEGLGEDSRVVKCLKTIHQSIIAPSVIELRLGFFPTLPFKV